jgi:hypothetical protein
VAPSGGASSGGAPPAVTLQTFEAAFAAEESAGGIAASVLACMLGVLLLADCLLQLTRDHLLEQAQVDALAQHHAGLVIPLVIFVQVLFFWGVMNTLRTAHLRRQIEPTLLAVATFGLGVGPLVKAALVRRAIVFVVLLAGLAAAMNLLPEIEKAGQMPAWILGQALTWTLPIVGAWVFTVLIFRATIDRMVLLGLVLPVVALALLSTVTGVAPAPESGFVGPPLPPFHPVDSVPFRLVELVLAWATLGAFAYAMVASSFESTVVVMTGEGALDGPLFVEHSPTVQYDARQRFIMFRIGEAHMLAFTRAPQAEAYELVDVSDEHARTPVHDRSLKIWNVTRLLASMPRQVRTSDSRQYLELSFSLGMLARAKITDGNRIVSRAAVDIAAEMLIKNKDLYGLIQRSARDAFDARVGSFGEACAAMETVLQMAPVVLDTATENPHLASDDEFAVWSAKYRVYAEQAKSRLGAIGDAQTRFRAELSKLKDWRNASNATAKGTTLEDEWLTRLFAQFVDVHAKSGAESADDVPIASEDPAARALMAQVRFLVKSMGLQFNEVAIHTLPNVDSIGVQVERLRTALDAEFRRYEGYFQEALRSATQYKRNTADKVLDHDLEIQKLSAVHRQELQKLAEEHRLQLEQQLQTHKLDKEKEQIGFEHDKEKEQIGFQHDVVRQMLDKPGVVTSKNFVQVLDSLGGIDAGRHPPPAATPAPEAESASGNTLAAPEGGPPAAPVPPHRDAAPDSDVHPV